MKLKFFAAFVASTLVFVSGLMISSVNAQKTSGFNNILKTIEPNPGTKLVPQMILDLKTLGVNFERRELFAADARPIAPEDGFSRAVDEGVLLNLSRVNSLSGSSPEYLLLPVPDGKGGTIELELARVNILAPGFEVKTSGPADEIRKSSYGIHYRGMVRGDAYSLVAISVYDNEIMGSIRSKTIGNGVLGRLDGNNPTNRHIFYDANKLKVRPEHFCNVKNDAGEQMPMLLPDDRLQSAVTTRVIRKYIEANFDVFQNKGSSNAVVQYVTGFFNQSATLFANDGINVSLQSTFVWTTASPYTQTNDAEVHLNAFGANRPTFNGDLAHLLTLYPYGGIAWVSALCGGNTRYAVSGIEPTFENVPTFSWTVEVFTHETGHNLGSPHTHNCSWNGNNTAIDSCAPVEGGCASPGNPAGGGTIMSYCHLQAVGINFTLGFGPQPKARVQAHIAQAPCIADTGKTPFDFDGDRKTDVGIFRPSVGEWWYLRSSDGGNAALQFGMASDRLAPADYTGDGKTDIGFFRPSSGEWFILRSEDFSFYSFPFGANGDIPNPADFDGDNKADPAIFRPSSGTWFILRSTGGTTITQFGANGDKPVAADYDGDSKADVAIFRPDGSWWLNRSTAGLVVANFGSATDKTVPGDYTGDGKADVAFFRPGTNEWFVLRSEDFSFYSAPFGAAGDIPTPGDYDGDGNSDLAVFRPSNNTWYQFRSTSGSIALTFGVNGDQPIPNAFVR